MKKRVPDRMKTCRVMIILTFYGFLISPFDPHCVCVCAVQNLWRCWLNSVLLTASITKKHVHLDRLGKPWAIPTTSTTRNTKHRVHTVVAQSKVDPFKPQTGYIRACIRSGAMGERCRGGLLRFWLPEPRCIRCRFIPNSSTPQLIKPPDSQGLVLMKHKFTHHW